MNRQMTLPAFNAAELKELLLQKLDVSDEEFDEHENLFDYGLDSVDVMALIACLKAHGIEVSFIDMVREPTFSAWRKLVGV
ncbi:hypothetical protein HC231_13115 [Brenneria izadpanahii]|uniref:Carrier domain-containing protein n=1 Tax=Brenneria izadpanahii TaxID=2722756 RepID=A0ABX7UWM4_9GAMM|nr:phosphopantetheine-binding protein [Brenneria izadpanahii]QTF08737.1 hypothetical protein HC231_13115 [Brenneria izadpanahii]